MSKSPYDYTGESYKLGKDAEDQFVKRASKIYEKCIKASANDDRRKHIDYHVYTNCALDLYFTVDVKAKKKIKRTDTSTQDELIWIELKNVSGNEGWLFGKADKVAFGYKSGFIMVERDDLVKFCLKNINFENFVSKSQDALYSLYKRKSRKDLLSLIQLCDLKKKVSHVII